MILNDIWTLFNRIIRGNSSTQIDKKMSAINEGYLYLAKRFLEKGAYLPGLLSSVTDVQWTISQNYADLPSDFLGLFKLWHADGTGHQLFADDQIKSYDELTEQLGSNFLDTTYTGTPSLAAILEPYIYLDKYASATDTDGLKIQYHKIPSTLVAYDRIALTAASGAFTVGETIQQATTLASGTVYAMGASNAYVDVTTSSRDGSFLDGYVITGATSGETATQAGSITEKPQVLEVTDKYKMELATSAAVMYLFYDDDNEANAKNESLESMLKNINIINKYGANFQIGIAC